jgi:uroporphyrinogen-III synthase/uroporphyrinogen III methyltransferase/synthase
VLVTRAAHQAGKLSEGLKALGAIPVEVPVLEIAPPVSFESLDHSLRKFDEYDWVIFTSANTVRALVERCAAIGVVARANTVKVAAVGAATAAAAREAGWDVAVVPENYVAEGLLAALGGGMAGKRVLLGRAAVARDVIPDALRAAGAIVDVADAYRNVIPANAPEQLRRALADGLAAVTFTSSSSVTHLADVAHEAGVSFPFAGVPAVSIGPITSQTLRESGWEPAAESDQHDISGLISTTARILNAPKLRANS